jgi:hypothetical protein
MNKLCNKNAHNIKDLTIVQNPYGELDIDSAFCSEELDGVDAISNSVTTMLSKVLHQSKVDGFWGCNLEYAGTVEDKGVSSICWGVNNGDTLGPRTVASTHKIGCSVCNDGGLILDVLVCEG